MSTETMNHTQDTVPVAPDEAANGAPLSPCNGDVGDDAHAVGAAPTDSFTAGEADGAAVQRGDGGSGVVSAPRSRRGDGRQRESRAACPKTRRVSHVGKNERGPWLSADGLSAYLALPSASAVRELERRGVLRGDRLGGSLRFSRPEIDMLLVHNRQATVIEIADGTGVTVPPAEGLGPLMSPEQAVAYLGLPSVEALHHRVRRGEVPCFRIGRQLRFRAVELDSAMRDEGRLGPRRLSAAERQLTFNDNLLTPEGRRPFAEGKGGK